MDKRELVLGKDRGQCVPFKIGVNNCPIKDICTGEHQVECLLAADDENGFFCAKVLQLMREVDALHFRMERRFLSGQNNVATVRQRLR